MFGQLQKGKHHNDKEFTYYIQVLTQECVWQKLRSTKVSNQSVNLLAIFGNILVVFSPQAQPYFLTFHFKVFSGRCWKLWLHHPELTHRHARALVFWGFVFVEVLFCFSSIFLTHQIPMKTELLSFMHLRGLCHVNNFSPRIMTKIRFKKKNTWKSHSAFRIRYRIFPIHLIRSCSRDIKIHEAEEKI